VQIHTSRTLGAGNDLEVSVPLLEFGFLFTCHAALVPEPVPDLCVGHGGLELLDAAFDDIIGSSKHFRARVSGEDEFGVDGKFFCAAPLDGGDFFLGDVVVRRLPVGADGLERVDGFDTLAIDAGATVLAVTASFVTLNSALLIELYLIDAFTHAFAVVMVAAVLAERVKFVDGVQVMSGNDAVCLFALPLALVAAVTFTAIGVNASRAASALLAIGFRTAFVQCVVEPEFRAAAKVGVAVDCKAIEL